MPTLKNKYQREVLHNMSLINRGTVSKSRFPDAKILDNYISKFRTLLESSEFKYRQPDDRLFNLYRLPIDLLRRVSGRYSIDGGKATEYWSNWFEPMFYKITESGQSIPGVTSNVSQIQLTELAESLLFGDTDTATEITLRMVLSVTKELTPIELYEKFIDKLPADSKDNIVITPINTDSLNAYIKQTENQILEFDENTLRNYRQPVEQSLAHAYMIRALALGYAKQTGKSPALVQYGNKSEFGRVYLQGINLQSCSKSARHAALGPCHQYDVAASVFAWRNDTARMIAKETGIKFLPSHTLAYLDNKNGFRKHIAQLCFPDAFAYNNQVLIEKSIKTAKQILTSIGFGATASNSSWYDLNGRYKTTAIKTLVTNNDNFENLINDKDFSDFLDEQRQITDIIVKYYTEKGMFDNLDDKLSERLKKNKAIKMAYLYQKYESDMIETVKALALHYDKQYGLDIILTVHDAIYTTKTIDPIITNDIRDFFSAPSFKLDHTVIRGNTDKTIESDHDREEREHHEHMVKEKQEVAAKCGKQSNPAVKHEMESLFEDETEQVTSMEDAIEKEKKEAEAEMMKVVEQRKEEAKELTDVEQARIKWRPNAKAETSDEIESRRAKLAKFMKK